MKKQIISIFLALCIMSSVMVPASASESGNDEAMTISEEGIRFIEEFEGYSKYAYADDSQWYIGYGTSCDKDKYPRRHFGRRCGKIAV